MYNEIETNSIIRQQIRANWKLNTGIFKIPNISISNYLITGTGVNSHIREQIRAKWELIIGMFQFLIFWVSPCEVWGEVRSEFEY